MSTKKYNVIKSLENDAPFSSLNFCTLSFLTPNKIDKIKYFEVYGFKVHNGYTSQETSDNDAKNIKKINNKHDVFVAEIGKLYNWDDVSQSDEIEYENEKLNNLEKTRREHADKAKILNHQLQNEAKLKQAKKENNRVDKITKRLQERLLERGCITKQEFDVASSENQTINNSKNIIENRKFIDKEIEDASLTDYLDENLPTGLKFGCITIFSPKNIRGLSTMCFKIRGLFETKDGLNNRIKSLSQVYPHDTIHTFEVGKWIPFTNNINMDYELLNKQLNYGMKIYLEILDREGQEFNERKEYNKSKAIEKAQAQKSKNDKDQHNDDNIIEDNITVYNENDRENLDKMFKFLNDDSTRHNSFKSSDTYVVESSIN